MKHKSTEEEKFIRDYNNAMYDSNTSDLCNILGRHATYMIQMAVNNNDEYTRGLMDSWVKIYRTNNTWISAICLISDPHSDFDRITSKIVRGLSDFLGDYIIDQTYCKKKFKQISSVTTKFYIGIGKRDVQYEEIRRLIEQYMLCVMRVADTLIEEGKKSAEFFVYARDCIHAAQVLGTELDCSILYQ